MMTKDFAIVALSLPMISGGFVGYRPVASFWFGGFVSKVILGHMTLEEVGFYGLVGVNHIWVKPVESRERWQRVVPWLSGCLFNIGEYDMRAYWNGLGVLGLDYHRQWRAIYPSSSFLPSPQPPSA
jgi:hypothetical protein